MRVCRRGGVGRPRGVGEDQLRPGVLFDVDGTLLDTNCLHVLVWWQAFRNAGHDGADRSAAKCRAGR